MDQPRNQPQKPKDDSCKIRIKNTRSGKEISFHGNCSKSQIQMAQGNIPDLSED